MKNLLPPEKPKHGGKPGKDNRMMLNGIFVLAEYRDPMAGPAGALRPVEKRVHPVPPMEPARCLGVHF